MKILIFSVLLAVTLCEDSFLLSLNPKCIWCRQTAIKIHKSDQPIEDLTNDLISECLQEFCSDDNSIECKDFCEDFVKTTIEKVLNHEGPCREYCFGTEFKKDKQKKGCKLCKKLLEKIDQGEDLVELFEKVCEKSEEKCSKLGEMISYVEQEKNCDLYCIPQ